MTHRLGQRAPRRRPLSLLTEDAGWRHRAPAPGDGSEEVAASATSPTSRARSDRRDAAFADLTDAMDNAEAYVKHVVGHGAGAPATRPRLRQPHGDPRHARAPRPRAHRGPRTWRPPRTRSTSPPAPQAEIAKDLADDDPRLDRGTSTWLRIHERWPRRRPALSTRCLRDPRVVDPLTVLDDQLCSNGGQFALLACGTYRPSSTPEETLNEIHEKSATRTSRPRGRDRRRPRGGMRGGAGYGRRTARHADRRDHARRVRGLSQRRDPRQLRVLARALPRRTADPRSARRRDAAHVVARQRPGPEASRAQSPTAPLTPCVCEHQRQEGGALQPLEGPTP